MIASPAIVAHFSIRRLIWPRKFSISALCSIRYQSSFAVNTMTLCYSSSSFSSFSHRLFLLQTSRPTASEPRFANRSAVASFEPKPMPDHDAWSAPHQHRKSLA
ncbi:hypothetical protein ACOSQ2_024895 [Xanthoceras sorbifolium]